MISSDKEGSHRNRRSRRVKLFEMSLPPLNPEKTTSGIIVDPRTLERVVPASKRSDGTYVILLVPRIIH